MNFTVDETCNSLPEWHCPKQVTFVKPFMSSSKPPSDAAPDPELAIKSLLVRYGVSRQTFYDNYFPNLGITPRRQGQQAYITRPERDQLDAMVVLLRSGNYESVAEAVRALRSQEAPTAAASHLSTSQVVTSTPMSVEALSVAQPQTGDWWVRAFPTVTAIINQVMSALLPLKEMSSALTLIANKPDPAPLPPSRTEQLDAIAKRHQILLTCAVSGILLSTSHVAQLLELTPGTVSSRPAFNRCGFRFTKAGRGGRETEWKVSKLVATPATSQPLTSGVDANQELMSRADVTG